MRLFVAFELPGEMLDALAETSALLRGSVRGRFVARDSLHVTLAFLGEVGPYQVNDVITALEEGCAGFGAFEAALGELGSFGRRSSATLWQGFRDADSMKQIAESVRQALKARGLSFDDKPFRAHVTLMRAVDLRSGELPMPVVAGGIIDTATLFKSDLSGPRPVYEPLHSVKLL